VQGCMSGDGRDRHPCPQVAPTQVQGCRAAPARYQAAATMMARPSRLAWLPAARRSARRAAAPQTALAAAPHLLRNASGLLRRQAEPRSGGRQRPSMQLGRLGCVLHGPCSSLPSTMVSPQQLIWQMRRLPCKDTAPATSHAASRLHRSELQLAVSTTAGADMPLLACRRCCLGVWRCACAAAALCGPPPAPRLLRPAPPCTHGARPLLLPPTLAACAAGGHAGQADTACPRPTPRRTRAHQAAPQANARPAAPGSARPLQPRAHQAAARPTPGRQRPAPRAARRSYVRTRKSPLLQSLRTHFSHWYPAPCRRSNILR